MSRKIEYLSTRSAGGRKYPSAYVIKQGIAPDGGLFVPEKVPALTGAELSALAELDYPALAARVIGMFLTDYTEGELSAVAKAAYGSGRFPAPAVKLERAGGNHILELWHGPTCAFKDMALQIMPRLLSLALKKTGEEKDALILVATSGDTGKAALEGYADAERVGIQVFYPADGVSGIQKKQMVSQEGGNVRVTAIDGNFDDAQNGVKAIFADKSSADALEAEGMFLSSANSINWGRLVPQIVYYIYAYLSLVRSGEIKAGEAVNVCVPTGNFGNILACRYAKRMGLPVKKMICASNKNNILTDFFATGTYNRNRGFYTTVSPSMDILISSNLERLLFDLAGADRCAGYMRALSAEGEYTLEPEVFEKLGGEFVAGYCGEEDTLAAIKRYFGEHGYLADTHTAVALRCADEYKAQSGDNSPMLVVSTASPYKFAPAVLSALGADVPSDEFAALGELKRVTGAGIPAGLAGLKAKRDRFEKTVKKDQMAAEIIAFAKELKARGK